MSDFDPDRGLGTITAVDGRTFPFHAVEIADGSRSIEAGSSVRFQPLPRFGRWEAGTVVAD